MSNGVKLTFFFTVSLALHGAGLWAAAGRLEPRSTMTTDEIAIVDRDLFFRHAERSEIRTSPSLSSTETLAPASVSAVRPSQPDASVMPAPATAAVEPEHRAPATARPEAVARLELSTLDSTPSPRQQPAGLEGAEPERPEPERPEPERRTAALASVPLAAARPRIQYSADAAKASSRQSVERLVAARSGTPAEPVTVPPVQQEALEPAVGAEALAPARRAADPVSSAPPVPPHLLQPREGVAESASTVALAESARLEPAIVPEQPPGEPERIAAPDARAALRGTLPPPLITPRMAEVTVPLGAPELTPSRRGGVRLRASRSSELARPATPATAAPRRATPPAERVAARAPRPAPAPEPSARPDLDVAEAITRDLTALAPAVPSWRGEDKGAERFTRTYQGGECFFPLRLASRGDDTILGYGLQAESVRMFREAFAAELGTEPDIYWRPLTDAQCSGISFARIVLGQSAPSVHIGLDRKELENGEHLAGRVSGSRFDVVTLLVVDDSGLVHNVLEYLRPESDELEFSVPVHPVDDGANQVQLIIAVGASEPLAALRSTSPVHSDDFFPELLRQARATGATLELGLEDFVILGGA